MIVQMSVAAAMVPLGLLTIAAWIAIRLDASRRTALALANKQSGRRSMAISR
jgi:hypothetical protein